MSQDLYIYNSVSKIKEKFEPLHPPFVGLYVCGPTVYSNAHLGNARTYISFDIVNRYLRHLGYRVRYVRNITDVGHITTDYDDGVDRIGEQAKREQLEPMEIVQKYTLYFHEIMRAFNNLPPDIEPTATGHLIEQIAMIEKILANGFAYESQGSVYFDVKKYMTVHNYGQLSGRNVDDLLENTRELDGQEEKRFFADFALWKKAAPEHIMKWDSPWGLGFPGWHLECSAMSTKYLGETFDIHGGGMDLKFPHHESEVAQNTACTGHGPVKYWMHTNMLTVNGQKMSKSLGNSFLPHELFAGDHPILDKGYSPMTTRFFMLQAHYRSTLDFSNEALTASEKGFIRLNNALELLEKLKPGTISDYNVKDLELKCYQALNDDFNTPVVISHLFDAARVINSVNEGKMQLTHEDITHLKHVVTTFVIDIFGLKQETELAQSDDTENLMQFVLDLRAQAKNNKNFALSDQIRDQLTQLGFELKDTKEGTTWTKK